MINHLNLVYFITAARELNFTRAAEKLFISQQALSNHIASLEKDVGISLIDRKTPMKLTAAGLFRIHTGFPFHHMIKTIM